MKIILNSDWDIPIHPPVEGSGTKGHFVGRQKELSLLVNELFRRDSGSILITGQRGVGKTSLVYKAISLLKEKSKNVVVVLISASQLQPEDETNQSVVAKRLIIESIIRRLYSTTRDLTSLKDFRERIEVLYRKAVAAEVKLTDSSHTFGRQISEIDRRNTTAWRFSDQGVRVLIYGICFSVAVISQFFLSLSSNFVLRLGSLIFALPLPFAIDLSRETIQRRTSSNETSKAAEEFYQFDASIGNLEFDLEKLHRELSKAEKKLIYVIDELDKLEKKHVSELIKYFKNLFTLSEALFVFIADDEIYPVGWSGAATPGRRPIDYTYFTSRYFLSRPIYDDLQRYLRSVSESVGGSERELNAFFRSICFDAGNDFFDLRSALTDRISSFEADRPVIEFSALSPHDEQRARFHTVFTSLFERKYMAASHSKWHENERLQNGLFKHLTTIHKGFASFSFEDPQSDDLDSQQIRDCNALLTRLGALKLERLIETRNLRGIEVQINHYRYIGNIPEEPPETLSAPTEFEQRYINAVERYYEYGRALQNAFRKVDGKLEIPRDEFCQNIEQRLGLTEWGQDLWQPISGQFELHQQFLRQSPLPVVDRVDVEKRTKQVSNAIQSLLTNVLPELVGRMLVKLNPSVDLQLRRLSEAAELFKDAEAVLSVLAKRNPICVFVPGIGRQVAIVSGQSDEVRRSAEWSKPYQKTHRIVSIDDFGDADQMYSYSVYFVNTNSPEVLKISLTRVLKSTTRFWSSISDSTGDTIKRHTHIEFLNADGVILHASDEDAAPFSLEIGEQIVFGNKPYEVTEVIDSEPREVDGVIHYRRIVRVK